MITCTFENGRLARLRHVVTHAIVEKDGCLLLVKRAFGLPEGGKWALPGGFLNRGETLEKGALREFREETGWDGIIVALFRINSYPNRPHEDRQNVAVEYIMKPLQKTRNPDYESDEAEWIPIEKLGNLDELAYDHGKTVKLYLQYRKKPFPLPLIV